MALSNAERQRRWRQKRDALVRSHPEAIERALLRHAERCEGMSDQERTVLADKLTDCGVRTTSREVREVPIPGLETWRRSRQVLPRMRS